MSNKKKRVVIAISGGVDSSTACMLLMEQGYEVIGLTAIMCKGDEDVASKAAQICKKLGIQHHIMNLTTLFKNSVVNYFEQSYKIGLTPNPCVFCNKAIKWGALKDFAFNELKTDYYATGHYANIKQENKRYKLYRAEDVTKDQTYMLCNLTQKDLINTLFPLGKHKKSEIKQLAEEKGLSKSGSKESQDVCFIKPPETNSSYLIKKFGSNDGDILHFRTGEVLGRHQGTFNYTVGQRKGIRVSAPEPLYVIALDPVENIIYVGSKQDIYSTNLFVKDINWQQEEFAEKESFEAMVKIRYNSPASKANVIKTENGEVEVVFEEPKSAITPGQIAVFYDLSNEYLLGGGVIE